jgi:hypothetical protein
MDDSLQTNCKSKPWNKGKLIGQKLPLKQREIWQIRANLEHELPLAASCLANLSLIINAFQSRASSQSIALGFRASAGQCRQSAG